MKQSSMILKDCEKLVDESYAAAVRDLLDKYGNVTDDFFHKESYENFLAGDTKKIVHGSYSRQGTGLYTHHIDENKVSNLSCTDSIRKYQPEYIYQLKAHLVYCNLAEHLVLHALIANETGGSLGFGGYIGFIGGTFQNWYIQQNVPKDLRLQPSYDASYLSKQDALWLLDMIENKKMKQVLIDRHVNKQHWR